MKLAVTTMIIEGGQLDRKRLHCCCIEVSPCRSTLRVVLHASIMKAPGTWYICVCCHCYDSHFRQLCTVYTNQERHCWMQVARTGNFRDTVTAELCAQLFTYIVTGDTMKTPRAWLDANEKIYAELRPVWSQQLSYYFELWKSGANDAVAHAAQKRLNRIMEE